MIDTHCHLFDSAFDIDRSEVVERACTAGVETLLLPNVDRGTHAAMMQTVNQYPGYCYPMIGIHPTSINSSYMDDMQWVEDRLKEGGYVAVGEIGVDCYWSKEYLQEQLAAFEIQLRLAEKYNLPVVIHARDSFGEILELLRRVKPKVRGVFHAFSGSIETYKEIKRLDGDYIIGIGGVITFKTAKLPEVVAQIPLEDIVLETDAPYLPPVPYRGQRNESAYLHYVVNKIAEMHHTTPSQVVQTTSANARKMFSLQ